MALSAASPVQQNLAFRRISYACGFHSAVVSESLFLSVQSATLILCLLWALLALCGVNATQASSAGGLCPLGNLEWGISVSKIWAGPIVLCQIFQSAAGSGGFTPVRLVV